MRVSGRKKRSLSKNSAKASSLTSKRVKFEVELCVSRFYNAFTVRLTIDKILISRLNDSPQ